MKNKNSFKDLYDLSTKILLFEMVSNLEKLRKLKKNKRFEKEILNELYENYFGICLSDIEIKAFKKLRKQASATNLINAKYSELKDIILEFVRKVDFFDFIKELEPTEREIITNGLLYDFFVVIEFLSIDAFRNYENYDSVRIDLLFKIKTEQIFDHYETAPSLLKVYCDGFLASHYYSDLAFVNNFIKGSEGSVLDVGGNYGALGDIILSQNSHLSYFTYDLEGTFKVNKDLVSKLQQKHKSFNTINGDFFNFEVDHLFGISEAKNFDYIILGWVLHDWSDEQSLSILKKCHKHLSKNSKIYVLEFVNSTPLSNWLTISMAKGVERTVSQLEELLLKANFVVSNRFDDGSGRAVIEAQKNAD